MVCDQFLPLDELQVLVVDSNPNSRYLLTMVFEEYGVKTLDINELITTLVCLSKQIQWVLTT
jgi:CheY-like chemotaxis protein